MQKAKQESYKKFPREPRAPKAGKGKVSKGKSRTADRPFLRRRPHPAK